MSEHKKEKATMSNIYLSTSNEGDARVLWLNFTTKDGQHAMMNVNNHVNDRGFITKNNMSAAILEYFEANPS